MSRLRPLVFALLVAAGAALLLHGCQENSQVTEPEFAATKTPRMVSVTGAGTGSGKVTAPGVGEVPALNCAIKAGIYSPSACSQAYGWKSTVTLTATADPGSSFAGWSGACTGTGACKLMMVQSRDVKATFNGTGVATYTLNVTGSGTGSGAVKTPTGFSPAINCTITSGTRSGTCTASYSSGTSVSLTSTATTGSFDGWAGACSGTGTCTLAMAADRAVTASYSAPVGVEGTVGKWDSPVFNTPAIAVHLSYLLNGKTLLWGHLGEPQLWDPAAGFTQVADNTCSGNCELFCAGQTWLKDGRLLVAGGHNEALGDFNGLKQASIFNGTSWSPAGSMSYPRWYPTLVELENGDVIALSGTQDSPSNVAPIPERFNGSTWTALTTQMLVPMYPRAFVEPKNGWIYYAGEAAPRLLNPTGGGVWDFAAPRIVSDREYGAAVMLDSKVLYVGGGGGDCSSATSPLPENSAEMIDLAASSPTWAAVASMTFRRRHLNATILPDGTVLVTGGSSSCGFSDPSGGVFAAENFAPPPINKWTTWANASIVRVYHSTAMLLRDGRVLFTGGGDGAGVPQQFNYEIFSPPYLFKGTRPAYNLAGSDVHYGQPFVVTTSDAASIQKVTLIRHSATTHAFDAGQRLNTVSFTKAADGQSLTVTPPASGRIAPPGPYMLFIVNDKGVPSVAQSVLLSQ